MPMGIRKLEEADVVYSCPAKPEAVAAYLKSNHLLSFDFLQTYGGMVESRFTIFTQRSV